VKNRLLERTPLLIFLLASTIGLAVILVGWRLQSLVDNRPDPYWFSAMGSSLARGEGFSAYGTLLHRRSPLYPLVIGGIYRVFGEHQILVLLLQAILFGATCWLAQDLGRRLFNARTAVIAGVLCAIHPALLRYVADFHLETLFTALFTGSVWLSVRFYERSDLRRAAALGVVAALATLTKAVALLYPVVFAALWWFKRGRQDQSRKSLFACGAMFVVMGLTIAPWTVRNYAVTGHFVPVSTGFSDAFLRGYVFSKTEYVTYQRLPYVDGENEANAMFRELCAAEGAVWEQDDYQTDKILNRAAKRRLLESPAAFVRKTLVGLFTFWFEMTTLKNSLAAGVMALGAWVLAAIGLKRAWREARPTWLLVAPILYFNLLLAPLLALGRYSVPVLPCLIVLSAFGIDTLWARFSSPKVSVETT
jgi:4-amino-4-deoxy-L-arabinose transferase-like glycosyltransferase